MKCQRCSGLGIIASRVENGQIIRPAGVEYNYIEVYDVKPTTGNKNEVCIVDGVWYVFDDEWKETNLFTSKEEFRNIYGDYVPVYRLYGANIVKLDDITIKTGHSLGGVSVEGFTLSATLQPRYL